MPIELDHVVIAVLDLAAAVAAFRAAGFVVKPGGTHANQATENALIIFSDSTYIELLAKTGEAPLPGLVDFSPLVEQGEGLAGFALRTADLGAESARLREQGFAVSPPLPGERQRPDGRTLRWQLATLDAGFAPFLIEDLTPRDWRIPQANDIVTHPNDVTGIHAIEITAHDLTALRERYALLLNAPTQDSLSGVLLRAADSAQHASPELSALHVLSADNQRTEQVAKTRLHYLPAK